MGTQLLFPTVMYTADLEPPEEVSLGMFEYFKKYYARNRNIYRQNRGGNITGDVTGDFQIASKQQFFWLNNQAIAAVSSYLGPHLPILGLILGKKWNLSPHQHQVYGFLLLFLLFLGLGP